MKFDVEVCMYLKYLKFSTIKVYFLVQPVLLQVKIRERLKSSLFKKYWTFLVFCRNIRFFENILKNWKFLRLYERNRFFKTIKVFNFAKWDQKGQIVKFYNFYKNLLISFFHVKMRKMIKFNIIIMMKTFLGIFLSSQFINSTK